MGKSFVIFTSIFFSTTLLLFGVLVSGFADKAQESTFNLMNYETQAFQYDRVATLNEDQINEYGNNYDDLDYAYTFGVDFDYETYNQNTNPNAYQSDPLDPSTNVWSEVFPIAEGGYDPNKITDRFKAWQQDIIYYMKSTEIFRDKTYIEISNPEFIHSMANTSYLVYWLSKSDIPTENDLISKDLEFKTKTSGSSQVGTETLKGLTLQDILLKFGMLLGNAWDATEKSFNKILFDIYETSEQETLFNSTELRLTKINGEEQNLEGSTDEVKLYSGSKDSYESKTFNLNSWHRNDDLNKMLVEYENPNPDVLPVLIDYPTSKLLNIEIGDNVEITYSYMLSDANIENVPLTVEVIGIFETYMPLAWFCLNTEPVLIEYLEIYDAYQSEKPNASDMWYQMTDVFGVEDLEDELFNQSKEEKSKTYSCVGSENFYAESFFLIDDSNIPSQTILNLEPCFPLEIPKEYYVAMSTEGTELMNQMLGIFVGFAYIIVFVILIVISNETIQGSKREVSTLKALGYKTRTMSKIVLFGQAGVMILSIFVALPFTILVMNMITNLLLTKAGMFFDLTPVFTDIVIVIGVVMIIVVLTYILGTIIYKHTSPLDSLQRD